MISLPVLKMPLNTNQPIFYNIMVSISINPVILIVSFMVISVVILGPLMSMFQFLYCVHIAVVKVRGQGGSASTAQIGSSCNSVSPLNEFAK